MQIIDRLFKFFRENNLSNYKVEQACGLSNGYLRNLRKAPSAEILEKIFSAYPTLNREWVMTGEGSMCVTSDTDEPQQDIERILDNTRDHSETITALKQTIAAQQETIESQKVTIKALLTQIDLLKGGVADAQMQDVRVG